MHVRNLGAFLLCVCDNGPRNPCIVNQAFLCTCYAFFSSKKCPFHGIQGCTDCATLQTTHNAKHGYQLISVLCACRALSRKLEQQ